MPETDKNKAIGSIVGGDIQGDIHISAVESSKVHVAGRDVFFTNVVTLSDINDEELQNSYKKLLEKIDHYFELVAETLHDNPALQEEMLKLLRNAQEILGEKSNDPEWVLSRAQFEVRRVHVAISREQQLQFGEKRLSWIIPTLVLVYIVIIVFAISFGSNV